MASITISLASGTTGKLYATASSILHTSATQPSSSITITCDASGTTGADITLREATDGSHITNCPMLAIKWKPNGYTQEVLFGSSTANKPMAQFKYSSTTISYSTTTVPAGGTITVTALAGSGTADTTAPSDVGIGGYYYAHNGLGGRYNYSNGTYTYEEYTTADSNQGIRSKPARCGNRVPVDISFKYNGTAKYFVFMMMRGWAGASAGCPGDMGMLAGTGPIVNSTFQTGWADGYDTYRIDVFALSPSGIYPSPAIMPGDGSSQTSCPSNSTWVKWPEDSSLSTYNVTYYGTDGSTILRSNTEAKLPLQFTKVSNSAITFYKGSELYPYLSGDSGTKAIPDGKRFKGWQKKEGSGSYGNTITSDSGMGKVGSSNVSLKLVVEDDTVNVAFKSNYPSGSSGSTADRTQTWTIGSTQSLLSAPATPTRNGYTYTFDGWYSAASGGTKIGNAGASYTVPSSNTTLFAHWTETAVKYTITYDSNGGSSVSSQDYYATTNLTLASASTKTGHTFNGWKVTTAEGNWSSGTTYTSAQNVGTGKYGNVTLTAQWTVNTYTIEFVIATANYPTSSDGDAGNVPTKPANRTVTYGGTWAGDGYSSLPGLSTASGSSDNWDEYFDAWKWDYGFVGWFDAETGGVEKTATTTYNVAGNSKLYARWEKTQKKYTVTWKDFDGRVIKTDSNVLAGTLIQSLAPADPIRNGYVFSGWATIPSSGEVRDNYVFTAQYTPIQYTVTFIYTNPDYATIDASSKETSPFYYTIEQNPSAFRNPTTSDNTDEHNPNPYKFDGWVWSIAKHQDDVNTPPTPTNWTVGGKLKPADIPANTWGNITLTATWTPNPFTISFDVNLGEDEEYQTQSPVDTPNPITLDFGSSYGVSNISRNGYVFDGWYTEPTGGTKVVSSTILKTAKNHTLYAHWDAIKIYLEFNVPDDSPKPEDVEFSIESQYPYIIRQVTSKNGREFVGWWTATSGGEQITEITSWNDAESRKIIDAETGKYKIKIYAKFKVALTPFEPIPDAPGDSGGSGELDNGDYGIPVEDLDDSLQYRLVLTVNGDRTNGTHGEPDGQGDVFTMPSGTGSITRDSNNYWVWSYDTGIVSKQDLYYKDDDGVHGLMAQTIFTMNVWRVQVYHPTATLNVKLYTYEGNTQLGQPSQTDNDFRIGDKYVPYVSDKNEGENSDVLLTEGVDAIRALDLGNVMESPSALINAGAYEDIKDRLYTRRFIGNKRSTVMCKIKAHSVNEDDEEVLYGAIPSHITVRLDGVGYDTGNRPTREDDLGFNPNDEPNHVYESNEFCVTTDPFPNIVHTTPNDWVNGRFRIQVLDSRHYRIEE